MPESVDVEIFEASKNTSIAFAYIVIYWYHGY